MSLPKAPDHEVNYWRTGALTFGTLGLATWPIDLVGGAVMAAIFFTLAIGCWALTRDRE